MRALKFALLLMVATLTAHRAAAEPAIQVTVDVTQTGPPTSGLLYGYFTELLHRMYEGGPWAEMLGDRKFFYPVNSQPAQTPPNSRHWVGQWRPVGPEDCVTMDAREPWVGKHSPRVELDPAVPHGIQQAGLGLVAGKRYVGRVVLAGKPGTVVRASLVWGPNPGDRQTIRIAKMGKAFAKFPFEFTAGGNTVDGRLELTGTGDDSFRIGAVSLMPADNVEGYRADILALWKEIGPTIYRWPGGNFVSGYDWRNGIGDPDKRPPIYDYAWGALEPNDVGIHEFMTLTRLLALEPYICVNAGFGDAQSAAAQVEYMNGAATTPMGRLRAANGHKEPYAVKWWNIGNEMYGPWQLGHMSLYHYALKHNQFEEAMRAVDPSIKIVASGATPAEMSSTGAAQTIQGKPQAQFGDKEVDWTGGLLTHSAGHFDAIAEHLYPRASQYFDQEKQDWLEANDTPVDRARRLPNRVKCAVEAWEEYQRRFPKLEMKSIPIALDEWMMGDPGALPGGPRKGRGERASMFTAITAGEAMHELFRHSGTFNLAAYTASTGVLSFDKVAANIAPVGLMFKLYGHHFGGMPVAITGSSPQPEIKGTVDFDKPRVSSGSPTYPLDVVAATMATLEETILTIAVINPTEEKQRLDVTGVQFSGPGRLRQIAAQSWSPRNDPGKPREVDIVESEVAPSATLTVPKLSIQIFEFPVK